MLKTPAVAVILVAATSLAACGDSANEGNSGSQLQPPITEATDAATTSSTPAQSQPAAPGKALTIKMTEFAFDPNNAAAQTGKVKISAVNDGKAVHELVLLKTNADPAKLPMKGGKVDESTSVGEIADVEAGATKSTSLKLEPGKYAMVCALPGHYEGGMYGSLTVK